MSIPKEPRQQMINIMYLVLIALLALNVSAEILNAFRMLNRSIDSSNTTLTDKVSTTMDSFKAKVEEEKRGQDFLTAAEQARVISQDFQDYISGLDQGLLEKVGPSEDEEGNLTDQFKKPDDLDSPTAYFVEQDSTGYALQKKIDETRKEFIALFDLSNYKGLTAEQKKPLTEAQQNLLGSMALKVEKPISAAEEDSTQWQKTWARNTFYQMPAEACRTLLTKFKNDAISTEATVVDNLFAQVGAVTIIYDQFKAAVIPTATKLIQGEKYEAQIYLAATSSDAQPSITVNGQRLSVNSDGMAIYKGNTSSTGDKNFSGKISFKDTKGQVQSVDFKQKYTVVPPPDHVPVVSADKMNVFYIGVDNPITASFTGIPDSKVRVSMSGGTLKKAGGAGKYTVRVTSPGTAKINLSGEGPQGAANGSADFRVKRIPDPTAKLGKKAGGAMGSGEMRAQRGVLAVLEDFDFDARFNVLGFEMTYAKPREDLQVITNQGPTFGGPAKSMVSKASVGDIYYFDNIRVKGPDGTTRKLPTMSFKVR